LDSESQARRIHNRKTGGIELKNVWIVYDGKTDLPDELRIFENERAAKDYEKEMKKAGILDPLIVMEPVENSGKIKVEILDVEDKPKPEIMHKKVKPLPPLPPIPKPLPPPAEPEDPDEPEPDPVEENRDELDKKTGSLPQAIRNPRVLALVGGSENADLVDWESLDPLIHKNKNTYRAMDIMADLRMMDSI
jgi:hypothetical protein